MHSFIFFYPSRVVGGAEYLFIRLAKELLEDGANIVYIDYIDGFARRELGGYNITYIDYEDGEKIEIDISGTIVTFASNFYRIYDYIESKNNDLKLLFWGVHPDNICHVLPDSEYIMKVNFNRRKEFLSWFCNSNYVKIQTILKYLDDHKAIYFMDYENWWTNKELFEINFSERYLPVVCSEKQSTCLSEVLQEGNINIAILGRISIEKVYPLINVLENLYNLNCELTKTVHIIGEGEFVNLIDIERLSDRLNIIFTGTITNEELESYLSDKIDILFAMGTSLLEGASLKLPTIFMEYSYSGFYKEKFSWLFETTDEYNLGARLNLFETGEHSFSAIINAIYINNGKKKIGNKCYEHFMQRHSLSTLKSFFYKALQDNSLLFDNYRKVIANNSIHNSMCIRILRKFGGINYLCRLLNKI